MSVASRALRVFLGTAINCVGFALHLRAQFGLGPLFLLQEQLGERLGVTIGLASILTGATMALGARLLDERIGLGTLAFVVLAGVLTDVALVLTPEPAGLALRVGFLVVGIALMTLGGAIIITARIGAIPVDAFMLALVRVSRRRTARVRLAMEAGFLVAAVALGGAVGVGLVVTTVAMGPFMTCWLRVLRVESATNDPHATQAARSASNQDRVLAAVHEKRAGPEVDTATT